ncbi:MAG: hypothetical protein QG567_2498 [Campylobacterota bacterium]|nr:hypothetical protein [Campylobacterota bacterium]
MAYLIEFIKPDEVNGQKYEKGDSLSVGGSIYATLKANGTIKDFVEAKPKVKGK